MLRRGTGSGQLGTGRNCRSRGWLYTGSLGSPAPRGTATFGAELPPCPLKGKLPPSGGKKSAPSTAGWSQVPSVGSFGFLPAHGPLQVGGRELRAGGRGAPRPPPAAAGVRPPQAGRRRGPRRAGRSRAARPRQEEARPAAGGSAPVCVQSGSAGCARSRAATRKQTRGNSSAPSARSPCARRRLRSPRARRAGPAPRPAPLAPPPPRPAPAGAGSLTYRPTRARSRTTRPAQPARIVASREQGKGDVRGRGRLPRLARPGEVSDVAVFRRAPGGPRLRASPAGGRGRPGSRGSQVAQPDIGAGGAAGRAARRDRARCGRGEGPEELSPPRRASFQPRPRPRRGSSRLPGWRETMKCV